MRLSQINIAGFKSFVDPVKIAFPANVTAIVGPNGCGKSNVIDAVRWVMGESSAKNLRGDSLEDVIFSGSSTRKPVGQASVELIFDNSDGRVKGEYAKYNEISVKRLATRVGQSKYFLNNVRCRRRDIADIFLGTGLGPRSYSIIEQGMVSRIIDAKPDELRVYLEEAAGISKYKERRRETETRISHTRENLDRLRDLIEEIDNHLLRLKRQSRSAEKYKRFKQDARRLEAESLLLQKMAFDSEIEDQNRELASAETTMQEKLAQFRHIEKQIEEARQQLQAASDRHNEVQSRYYRLGSDISGQEQSIEHQQNLRQHNRQELENIRQSQLDSHQIITLDQQKTQALESGLVSLRPQLEVSEQALKQQQQDAIDAEGKLSSWQDQWDQFSREFHQAHESVQIENRGIEHIERQVTQSRQRRKRLLEELESLEPSSIDPEIEQLERLTDAKIQEHAATLEQVENRADEIRQLRQAIDAQSTQLDEKRNRVQTLRGRLSALEALQQPVLAETSKEIQNWLERHQIVSAKRLTEVVKVKDGFEKAAEVVLAPFLGAYCIAERQSLPDTILPDHNIALFDRQRNRQDTRSSRQWPRLLDYIDCDIDLSSLLCKVYLCRDMQELNQRKGELEAGESLVTASGHWAGSNWMLQLGDKDQHSGMLGREQEIGSIRRELEEITQSALVLKSQTDGERQRLHSIEQQWDEDQRRLNRLQQQASDIRDQLTQRKGRVDQVQIRYQQLQKELGEIDEGLEAHKSELQENSVKRHAFLTEIERMTTQQDVLLEQKSLLQESLGASRSQLQQARDQFHQLQMKLQSVESEHRSTLANIERIVLQNEQYDRRIEELTQAIDGAGEPIESMENSLQALLQSRVENEKALGQAQENVTGLDHQQRELEAQRHEAQQAQDEARDKLESQRMHSQEFAIRSNTIEQALQKTGFDLEKLKQALDPEAESEEWQKRLDALSARIDRLGPINLAAIDEHREQSERKEYLDAQNQDLVSALEILEAAMQKIDRETRDRFKETFDQVNSLIGKRFPKLFGGGEARLEMTEDNLLSTGVMVMARPPGKRITNLQLLSGGEKAMTAVALIFAIFDLNPAPFCMLDEVDAPLDDANVGRFCAMVEEMSEYVQFIMISHNKITIELAQNLNGVTMHEPGVSRLVSVDIGEAVELAGVK
ncbi:MAG: chromosome segregation protein SMC [Proteobacteria bacterium]|nr:chromosome segregation protein SMC [Pseudomonadota bacterium]